MLELVTMNKHMNSLINYIRKQPGVIDYYADMPYVEAYGFCVPKGVVVACDLNLLHKLQAHAKRYYPDMSVSAMTVAECIAHMDRPHIK